METDSLKRSLSSPSFSGRRNQNFGAGLLARSSVSELAAWYQEIFGCGNHCSAQEAPKNDSPQMSRSKSTESLAFHLTNPCEITGRNFVGGHFISRSAAALPTLVEFLAESPAPDPQGKSPTEFSKMAAIRHPDSKFQLPQENSMSSFSSQHNKKKEQGGHTVCLQENESVQKEAKFTRRSKAAPSASVTRIVENWSSPLLLCSSGIAFSNTTTLCVGSPSCLCKPKSFQHRGRTWQDVTLWHREITILPCPTSEYASHSCWQIVKGLKGQTTAPQSGKRTTASPLSVFGNKPGACLDGTVHNSPCLLQQQHFKKSPVICCPVY
ncbi:uncharacterized protein LOC143820890 [Paroedura picta]|uniref:uncharacterized protein LOC143820890 n=1 Tax=Paroedura picta TaxID=143630 RepID=UPI004056A582